MWAATGDASFKGGREFSGLRRELSRPLVFVVLGVVASGPWREKAGDKKAAVGQRCARQGYDSGCIGTAAAN